MVLLHDIARLLRGTLRTFRAAEPLVLGSSTAFFTLFAVPPILALMGSVLGAMLGSRPLEILFVQLAALVGEGGAAQIREVAMNFLQVDLPGVFALGGVAFLLFVATTLFAVIQRSIDRIWQIHPRREGRRVPISLRQRAMAFLVLVLTGVLFVAALTAEGMVAAIGDWLGVMFPGLPIGLVKGVNRVASFVLVTVWFLSLFRVLPSGKVPWWPGAVGAAFTAVLFTLGKYVLGALLVQSDLGSIYGASASVFLILLFVFYTANILYFGASFTAEYARFVAQPIIPRPYAAHYETRILEDAE